MPIPRSRYWLWVMVGCFLAYWLLRLPALLALPVHVDEAEYIVRAQWIWGERPLYFLQEGKVLTIGLTALFDPFNQGLFVGRYIVLLIGALGLALIYAVARRLMQTQLHMQPIAGVAAALLWLGTPQLIFFERMALLDAPLASFSLLTFWLSLRMLENTNQSWRRAALCGVSLVLCIAVKSSGIIFLGLPLLVALFSLPRQQPALLRRLRQVSIAYIVAFGLLLPPALYLISVGADPLYLGDNRPASLRLLFSLTALIERLRVNLVSVIQAERIYLTLILLLLIPLCALILIRRNRRVAVLLLALTGYIFVAIIIGASKLWLRYVVPATPYLLLLTALGLCYLFARRWKTAPLLIGLGFLFLVGVPYALTAQHDPTQLAMPATDRVEYVSWVAAGYGIREASEYLMNTVTSPQIVFSAAGNCYGAKLLLSTPITVRCPVSPTWWDDPNTAYVQEMYDVAQQQGYVYVLAEDQGSVIAPDRLPQPLQVIKTFPRPEGQYNVVLYCAGAATPDRCPPS